VTLRRISLPDSIGPEYLGLREERWQRGFGTDYWVETWVRKGRYLVNLRVQKDREAPAKTPAVGLTRATLRLL
jgi:hypothetical protein